MFCKVHVISVNYLNHWWLGGCSGGVGWLRSGLVVGDGVVVDVAACEWDERMGKC